MNDFVEKNREKLAAFVRVSSSIGARSDYVQGGGGNTSVKLDGSTMAIKASGFCLADITVDNAYAVLDYARVRQFYTQHEAVAFPDVEKAGAAEAKAAVFVPDGLPALRPSVEAGFHSLLDTFVAHSHSVYANLAACAGEMEPILANALAGADYSYGFVPYVDPGATLTFSIRDELARVEKATGKRPAVLFMQNHGVIAHSDDPDACLRIHTDVNARVAAAFGVTGDAFPAVRVANDGAEGAFVSATPYLATHLQGDAYPDAMLLSEPLYPDQLVFFTGTLGETAVIDRKSGLVHYRGMPEKTAKTMEETLTAVVFITEHIRAAGYTLSTMGEAAKKFIANWESEKYRKSLQGGKQ